MLILPVQVSSRTPGFLQHPKTCELGSGNTKFPISLLFLCVNWRTVQGAPRPTQPFTLNPHRSGKTDLKAEEALLFIF